MEHMTLANSRIDEDSFYSENNLRYLEMKKQKIDEGRAQIGEHDLIEVDDNI